MCKIAKNVALVGAAGYIAPRHMQAIKDNGCKLVAAVDPHDSVGILDRYSLDTKFFKEPEIFNKYLEQMQHGPQEDQVDWVSVCTPNYLHSSHICMALKAGSNVLCEKPLVIDPRDLDMLELVEQASGRHLRSVLQLRLSPSFIKLKEEIDNQPEKSDYDVSLTYITARGAWYDTTWKSDVNKSGGVGLNIGIHLLDILLWLFGDVVDYEVHLSSSKKMSGVLQLQRAKVKWFLSIDSSDLPFNIELGKKFAYRELAIDGNSVEFSNGFTDLHGLIYKNALAGGGFGIDDARPSVELAYKLSNSVAAVSKYKPHPFVTK